MDPADYAIHQCVFECTLELPTSNASNDAGDGPVCIWNLYPGVVDRVHQWLRGLHTGAASMGLFENWAPKYRSFGVENDDEPWWPIKFLASPFSEKPISVCFWMERKMKNNNKQLVPSETPMTPDETCFFWCTSSGFEAPAWERTTITRDCADLWLHRGLFRLDLLLGTLGTAKHIPWWVTLCCLEMEVECTQQHKFGFRLQCVLLVYWGYCGCSAKRNNRCIPLIVCTSSATEQGLAQPNLLKEFTIRRFNMQPKAWRSDIGKTCISSHVSTGFHVKKHDWWYDLIWFVMINHDFPINAPNYASQSLPQL